jgi:hypothetical protein
MHVSKSFTEYADNSSSRPDYQQRRDGLQGGGESPGRVVSGKINNISLNVNKAKELIVDFGRQQREHSPIHINGAAVERMKRFMFLCVHITDNLKWVHPHRQCGEEGTKTLTNFYRCTIESILPGIL